MSNFGALAILAMLPEDAPARHWRLLIALETFPDGDEGWRSVSTRTLRDAANVSRTTFRRGSHELAAAGLIEYEPGVGKGNFTRWRILFSLVPDSTRKGVTQVDPFPGRAAAAQKGPGRPRKRVQADPVKGSRNKTGKTGATGTSASRNAASGADARRSAALEPSALETSALDTSHLLSPAGVEGSGDRAEREMAATMHQQDDSRPASPDRDSGGDDGKGICPVCGERAELMRTMTGPVIRNHGRDRAGEAYCPGTGEPPAEAEAAP